MDVVLVMLMFGVIVVIEMVFDGDVFVFDGVFGEMLFDVMLCVGVLVLNLCWMG